MNSNSNELKKVGSYSIYKGGILTPVGSGIRKFYMIYVAPNKF